jgi:hypothetical protein
MAAFLLLVWGRLQRRGGRRASGIYDTLRICGAVTAA